MSSPAEDRGGAGEAWVQSFSRNSRQVYATKPSSRAILPLAVIPEAARLGDLGESGAGKPREAR